MRHGHDLRRSPRSCCCYLGWRDDVPLPGLGAVGQESESGAGVHGAVSIRGAAVSPTCLGSHGDTGKHRPDAVVTTWHPYDGPRLMAGDRDGEAGSGESLAVPDPAARPLTRTQGQPGQRDSGITAYERRADGF